MTEPQSLAAVRMLLDRGYTPDKADAEICMGAGGPGTLSYEIRRGRIRAPWFSSEWHSFRALANQLRSATLEPAQGDLFGEQRQRVAA